MNSANRANSAAGRATRIAGAGLVLVACLLLPVAEGRAADARETVQGAVDQTLIILRDKALSSEQKRSRIEKIAYAHFDFERMAKLALARSYKKLDAEQRVEFQQEFRRHLGLTYGRSIEAYSDEGIELGDTRTHKNGDVTVAAKIVGGKNDGATLDWRMRQRDEAWLAIDVVIEGVSMIANFRSQVQEIVKTKGPVALIAQLREKNDATANAE